ncbi:MAG: hypothetical protein JWN15_2382, partial [Firmicutes bacterium]|nr:hypothetical protein [Bacillota bacterium]
MDFKHSLDFTESGLLYIEVDPSA